MRFKFKNGNRQCSIEGQSFVADAHGIFTIPAALAARAALDWAGDIVPAHHIDTDKPIAIDDMTHDMLVEALVEATKRRLANASLEELRALAASAAGYPTLVRPADAPSVAESNVAVDDSADEFEEMDRSALFAWLGDHDVSAKPAMTNDALRALARAKADEIAAASPAKPLEAETAQATASK
jgi:hypothetical protein